MELLKNLSANMLWKRPATSRDIRNLSIFLYRSCPKFLSRSKAGTSLIGKCQKRSKFPISSNSMFAFPSSPQITVFHAGKQMGRKYESYLLLTILRSVRAKRMWDHAKITNMQFCGWKSTFQECFLLSLLVEDPQQSHPESGFWEIQENSTGEWNGWRDFSSQNLSCSFARLEVPSIQHKWHL